MLGVRFKTRNPVSFYPGHLEPDTFFMLSADQIARLTIRELLDLNPEVRRYLLARSPDI